MRITLPTGTAASIARAERPSMGLVVAPDIFGLRKLYDDMVERYATEWNMTAVAVEPFPGRGLGDDLDERFGAVPALDDECHLRDLLEAADATEADTVGLIGFCMGGMYCFKSARSDRFSRIASFYGMIREPANWVGPGHVEPLEHLADGHPDRVLAIIGDRDPFTPPADVAELEATGVTVVHYPEAEHGFAHAPEREAHRPDDAADAFARARRWLEGG